MDGQSVLNATTPPLPNTKTTTAGVAAGKESGGSVDAASAALSSTPGTSVSLSELASSLKGPALDLFNKLKSHERTLLGDLVASGRMTGAGINDALTAQLKQARLSAFNSGAALFEARNRDLFARAGTVTGDDIESATEGTLAFRKGVASRLDTLEDDGLAGSDAYRALEASLSGEDLPGRGEELAVNGHPRSTRMVSPYVMNLGDSAFIQDENEQAAARALAATGVSLPSLAQAARGMAEDDVAAMVTDQARQLAAAT